jgi:hypothetical protein
MLVLIHFASDKSFGLVDIGQKGLEKHTTPVVGSLQRLSPPFMGLLSTVSRVKMSDEALL